MIYSSLLDLEISTREDFRKGVQKQSYEFCFYLDLLFCWGFFLDQGPSKPVEKPCSFCSLYFVKPSVSIFILFSGVHRYQSEQIAERVAIYSAVITRRNWMSYRLFNCL